MTLFHLEYTPIFILIVFALVLALIIFGLSYALAISAGDPEKLSPYECGFDAFEDARMQFDVKYFLVAILFIIFDLEIAFLFPWAASLHLIGDIGFYSMIFFLFLLVIGFFYEWKKGAMNWS